MTTSKQRTTDIIYKQVGQNLNCIINKKLTTVKISDKDLRDNLKKDIEKYNALKDHKTPIAIKALAAIMKKLEPTTAAKKEEIETKKANLKVQQKVVKNKIKNETTKSDKIKKMRSLDEITKEDVSPEEITKMKEILAKEAAKEQPKEERKTTGRGHESYR